MKHEPQAKDKDRINLRLPTEVFTAIDKARARRPGSISRNTWITEAVQEKLLREAELSKSQEGAPDA